MPAREPLTRDKVIDAARQLIAEEGMAATSLRKLAARLGVTAPALYAYVEDRRDLLRSVAEDALSQLSERFTAVEGRDPLARLAGQCRAYVDFATDNPDLFVVMFAFPPELPVASPLGLESAMATKVFVQAAQTIEEAVAGGQLPPVGDPIEAALTVWATVHGVATILNMGFGFTDEVRSTLVERAVQTVVAGLRAHGQPSMA